MRWLSVLGTLLLATAINGFPLDAEPEAELVPPLLENTTLSTELRPPPIDTSNAKGIRRGVVYLINLYAVTNATDLEDGEEKLTDEIIESMPGIMEPIATVLLIVEADDEEDPVSLDDIAKELEAEGFSIEKVMKDGETKVIKVDFDDENNEKVEENLVIETVRQLENTTNKVRRKRAPCLKCKLGQLLGGGGGGYGGGGGGYGGGGGGYGGGGYGGGYPSGGGCQGGCGGGHPGGGGNSVGVIPVVVVPVQGYPSGGGGGGGHYPSGGGGGHYPSGGGGGGHYPSGGGGGGHYPSGGGGGGNYPSGGGHQHPGGNGGQCNVCGGQGGGGGGSWSQSSAQASAQSSSGSW